MSDTDLIRKQVKLLSAMPSDKEMGVTEINVAGAMSHHKVVVVVPAYNEERFIGSVVLKAYKYADAVIVVDDGSTDGTAQVAKAAGADVIIHEQNQGKGTALNTGFRRARELDPDVVVTIDADGQHLPEEMMFVIKPIFGDQADIVVGSRYLQKKWNVPRHRVWGHYFFNLMTNQLSGVAVTDSQSGFRAFSRRALLAISFNSKGFSVESEMQFLASAYHLRINEVPITIRYPDKPKRFVISHGLMVLSGILQLIGQHRPLFFFGVPGVVAQLMGLLWGIWIVQIYRATQTLPIGYTLLSGLLMTLGALSFFTGIILHSIRGLLLDLLRPKD